MFRKLMFVVMFLAISLSGVVPAFAKGEDHDHGRGAVYVMSNSADGNEILVFSRAGDGMLTYTTSVATGGSGTGPGEAVPPDPLGSQNSLLLSPDGEWLFAVNAGSDEVSVFSITRDGLSLTDKVSSGGSYPVSLTFSHGLLYVLNAGGDGNITGFRLSHDGQLNPLDDSTRSLNANTPSKGAQVEVLESPGQVGFSPWGDFLVVTNKGGISGQGQLLVFTVGKDGLPSEQPATTITKDNVPFSFTFDKAGHLVVVDASTSMVTSYQIEDNGSLETISSIATTQKATCWIVQDGRYLFTDNTGSSTISAIQTDQDGNLTLVNSDGIAAATGAGSLPIDLAVTHNGRFIYTLETGAGTVGMFRVNDDGSLTSLGTAGSFTMIGPQGIAAR